MEFHAVGRPKKIVPDYRYHVSGQAVVTFNGANFYLGPHESPESRAKYSRLIAEYIEGGYRTPESATHQAATPITVADVCAEYREHIKKRYANAPKEILRLNRLCEFLELEHGDCVASEFGPRRLEQVRDTLIATGNCRRYVNRLVRAVRQVFRHALSRELIDPLVLVKLESLEPLRHGQTSAPESEPVKPVDLNDVRKTAKYLSPTIKAMLRIQAATGMRPGELCRIRPCDIDRKNNDTWVYRPAKHKTAHRGKSKAVPILGDARAALLPFLERAPDAYCFSPGESMQWYLDELRRNRKSKVQPSQVDRSKADPAKQPGDHYDPGSYRQAITRAAKKAKVPHWFPYQLRHTAGTMVREALGVEAAQALLGHSRASMTEHYAKQSEAKAIEAAMAAPNLSMVEIPNLIVEATSTN
jgi:integrase